MNGLCSFCCDKTKTIVYKPDPTKQVCAKCRQQLIDLLYNELAIMVGIEDDDDSIFVDTHSINYDFARARLKQSKYRFDDVEKLR